MSWLSSLNSSSKSLKAVKFTVFGCGNREWVRTYQRIPTIIDEALGKNGAERLLARGEADASSISFFSAFEDYETALWKTLGNVSRPSVRSKVEAYNTVQSYATVRKLSTFEEDEFSIEVVDVGIGRAKLLSSVRCGNG